jgi:tRNA (Thr-GGU) A37 N-methylase
MTPRAAYGYVFLPNSRRHDAELRWRRELVQLAHLEGLTLLGVFVDESGERPDGYAAMVEALARRDVRRVLVPSLEHFAHIPRLAGLGPGAVAR